MADNSSYDVVIVAYNDAETLSACLEAVHRMTPASEQVIVVDNASNDCSAAIAEAAGCRVSRLSENTGFAGGMNHGISIGRAPWVLLINPDCAPEPDFVQNLLAAVSRHPQGNHIGSATGLLFRADGADLKPLPEIDAAGMVVTASGRHFDRAAGEPETNAPTLEELIFGGTGAATLFRRRALEDVQYPDGTIFPQSFFCYREDAELAWRLQWRGWHCVYVPSAHAAHRRGFRPEAGRKGHEIINRHSVKNRFLLRAHCADLGWHLRCFPNWLIRDFLVIGACLTVEWSSLPALFDAWKWRNDATERRRWVLSRRRVSSRRMARWFRTPVECRAKDPVG